jgi:quercetin dioxygenase-like cupin family protein
MSGNEVAEVVVVDADAGPDLDLVEGRGHARAAVWPGMGAKLRSMSRISLASGSRTAELRHPSEAVYYVISGGGATVDCDAGTEQELVAGSMVHVEAGTAYRLAGGPEGIEVVGGPSPADPDLYAVDGQG